MNKNKRKWLWWLALHLLLGLVLANWRFLSTWWGAGAFFWFFTQTLSTRNRGGMAHLGAAYIVGMEVLLRMTKATLFWEFGKLACIALLGVALLVEFRKGVRWQYLLLLLLFMPSLFLATDLPLDRFRQMVTFQLGGMTLLIISAVYFSGRYIDLTCFQNILRYMLLPIVTMTVYLFLRTPSLQEVKFYLGSNFEMSGGFGPNQVSTILGLGMMVLLSNYLLRFPPLFTGLLDKFFFGLLAFRALLTFSRGGVAAAMMAVLLAYMLYLQATKLRQIKKTAFRLVAGLVLFAGLFWATDQLTNHLLLSRYKGEHQDFRWRNSSYSFDQITSGRTKILKTDLLMFIDYPLLGVGLGESSVLRTKYGYHNISHLEQTRLLSEHGILGLILLLWLMVTIAYRSFSGPPEWRFITMAFCGLTFFTMLHSATRLAMVGFSFGLGLIHFYANYSLHWQPPFSRRGLSQRG